MMGSATESASVKIDYSVLDDGTIVERKQLPQQHSGAIQVVETRYPPNAPLPAEIAAMDLRRGVATKGGEPEIQVSPMAPAVTASGGSYASSAPSAPMEDPPMIVATNVTAVPVMDVEATAVSEVTAPPKTNQVMIRPDEVTQPAELRFSVEQTGNYDCCGAWQPVDNSQKQEIKFYVDGEKMCALKEGCSYSTQSITPAEEHELQIKVGVRLFAKRSPAIKFSMANGETLHYVARWQEGVKTPLLQSRSDYKHYRDEARKQSPCGCCWDSGDWHDDWGGGGSSASYGS